MLPLHPPHLAAGAAMELATYIDEGRWLTGAVEPGPAFRAA